MSLADFTLSGSGGSGKGTFPSHLFTQAASHNARIAARRAIRRALAAGVSPADLTRELLPTAKASTPTIPTLTDHEIMRLAHGLRAWSRRIPMVRN